MRRRMNKMAGLVLCLALVGCGLGYKVHPGSINKFDSQTADTLLQAKTLLDNSRPLITAKTQPLWTTLAKAYDTALPVYTVWRNQTSTNPGTIQQTDALNRALSDLVKAMNAWKKGIGQ